MNGIPFGLPHVLPSESATQPVVAAVPAASATGLGAATIVLRLAVTPVESSSGVAEAGLATAIRPAAAVSSSGVGVVTPWFPVPAVWSNSGVGAAAMASLQLPSAAASSSGVGATAMVYPAAVPDAVGSASGVGAVVFGSPVSVTAVGSASGLGTAAYAFRLRRVENLRVIRTTPWTSASLTWDAVPGATGYTIRRWAGYRVDAAPTTANVATNSETQTGLDAYTTYSFQVFAYATAAYGAPSSPVFVHAKQETS